MQRSAAELDKLLQAKTSDEKESARKEFITELSDLLGTLKHEVGKVGSALDSEHASRGKDAGAPDIELPGSPSYDWNPFLRRIRSLQTTHQFLAVKWLRETKFADEPEAQNALQVAIDRSMLVTYFRDNPKKPQFPTLCCKLNQEHSIVLESLGAVAANS
ncbi:MAG: hypothetical protein IH865_12810 [Chloroflexi bacterium]|nr:hypothetical protein [Chloroflexota bacterium]